MGLREDQPCSSSKQAEPAVPLSSVCPRSCMQFPCGEAAGANSPWLLTRVAPQRADRWVHTVGGSSRSCGRPFL